MNRPQYQSISAAAAARRDWNGYIFQVKLDGRWHEKTIRGFKFVGELMPGGEFRPFDLISKAATAERLMMLASVAPEFAMRPADCGDFSLLKKVWQGGGEGVIAKPAAGNFGQGWIKIKRVETHDCKITAIHGESITLAQGGINRGRCPVIGGKLIDGWDYRPRIAALKVGDTVEIACHEIYPSGLFREPRFIRVRDDKD